MAYNKLPSIEPVSKRNVGNITFTEVDSEPIQVNKLMISSSQEDLPKILEGNIVFSRPIYSNDEFKRKINTDFFELSIVNTSIDVDAFFTQYNQLFYNIPQTGENSHTTLVNNSLEYINGYVDPKDQIIERLNQTILELELQLAGEGLNENPIFKNGTLIKGPDGNAHYMDQGYRRLVVFTPTFNSALKISIYGSSDVELPLVSDTMFNSIPIGPPLTEENFGVPFNPNSVNQEISNILLELDPQDINYNPSLYENINEFEQALIKDINEKQAVIDVLNGKISAINNQINDIIASDPEYNPNTPTR